MKDIVKSIGGMLVILLVFQLGVKLMIELPELISFKGIAATGVCIAIVYLVDKKLKYK